MVSFLKTTENKAIIDFSGFNKVKVDNHFNRNDAHRFYGVYFKW